MYSAGGKITHVNGVRLTTPIPQVFNRIVLYADTIKKMLTEPTNELLMLIEDYNPSLLNGNKLFDNWVDLCVMYAEQLNVPLMKWIKTKPQFTFSKK